MIPLPYKLLGVAVLLIGAFAYGKFNERMKWEADRAVYMVEYESRVKETEQLERRNAALVRKIEEDTQRIAAADAAAADVARRLSAYQARARHCAVSQAAGSTGDSSQTSGESGDAQGIERATERHLAACARDAERLTMWQEFYSGLRR